MALLFDKEVKNKNKEALKEFGKDIEDDNIGLLLVKVTSTPERFNIDNIMLANLSILEANLALDITKDSLLYGEDSD